MNPETYSGDAQHSIGIVIPTYQAAKHLPHCLPPLINSPLKPKILIIDSSSTDGTASIARSMGVGVQIIPQRIFNHGSTREMGRQHLGTAFIVMMTQDAYACSTSMLEYLIAPLLTKKASVSYARQLPHIGSSIFATFPRSFNYPPISHIRSIEDVENYGVYTFFCSNSCAAYVNAALEEIQGFPPVLFGEDTIAVAKLLHKKHKIAYVAEAEVRHSHDYTLRQEFSRHFDMGLSRQAFHDLIAIGGKDTKRGKMYVKGLLAELWKNAPLKIPYALMQTVIKLCGYRLGQASTRAPVWFKKAFSSQTHYWKP